MDSEKKMPFDTLIDAPKKSELVQITKKPASKKPKAGKLGCEYCPRNNQKHIRKIFGEFHKHARLHIFGMAPGPDENKEGLAFIGRAGQFLWTEARKVGIKRKHCNISNVVKCFPANNEAGRLMMRDPTKEELKCCSIHSENEIKKSEAKIFLLLGTVAQKQILGKEYRAGASVIWSERLKAKVYCLYHPSYFVRGAGGNTKALKAWRKSLAALAHDLKYGEELTPYGFIEKQDYKGIDTESAAKKEYKLIRKVCVKKKIRVACDIENDKVKDKNVILCLGTCFKPGRARVFLTHKNPKVTKIAIAILEDPEIEKVFHHGSYDVDQIEKLWNCKVRGYTYDTEYGAYFQDVNRRKFGLDEVGLLLFPEFGEYKTITLPECLPKDFDTKVIGKNPTLTQIHNYISARGLMHLSQLPPKKLVRYNGADSDLTKRVEMSTRKDVPLPLLRVYIDAAFTISEMTPNGPWFDFRHLKRLRKILPPRLKKLHKKLCKIAGKPDFNPNSNKTGASWLLYDKLGILRPGPDGKKSSRKGVLEIHARKHPVCGMIQEYRRLVKLIGQYMDSFEENAKLYGGRLRTKWNITGTRTGRLSSGGRMQKKGESKVVNLQNIVNDTMLQNLLTADRKWKKLYLALQKAATTVIGDKYKRKLASLYRASAEEKDKDKKWALKKELEAAVEELKKKILHSVKWKKLCRRILKVYGNVRVLLGFDQGQIEVRVAAQESGDENLIADCKAGDIHSRVGHTITGWLIEKIKKDKRTRTVTKNIHFGILFGLARDAIYDYVMAKDPDTTMTREEVEAGYDKYFERYRKVRKMIERFRRFTEETGITKNMFGFHRKLNVHGFNDEEDEDEEINSGGAFWGNQAINTPIQGAAHQLMMMAMALLRRKPKTWKKKLLGVPGMEVHDFMCWWTKLKNLAKAFTAGRRLLEKGPLEVVKKDFPDIDWRVPLEVEGKVGLRYGDTVEGQNEDGHVHSLEEMMLDMYLTSFQHELQIEHELEKVAA